MIVINSIVYDIENGVCVCVCVQIGTSDSVMGLPKALTEKLLKEAVNS